MRSLKLLVFALSMLVAGFAFAAVSTENMPNQPNQIVPANRTDQEITKDVAKQISHDIARNMVFDNLNIETKDGNVTLSGQARNWIIAEEAVHAARKVPGVKSVTNDVKLLPSSLQDDRLRLHIYWRLATDGRLFEYFRGVQPSINIIVNNGRVTLSGMVNNDVDRVVAGSIVRQMPGVLNVTNDIRFDRRS